MPDDVAGDRTLAAPPTPRTVWRAPCLGGIIGGAIGYASALTPSLLPVGLVFLLLLTALGTIVGYAIGSTIEWAVRKIPPCRRWRRPRWLVVVLIALFWIPALAFTPVAIGWQLEQQAALDMPEPLPGSLILALATLVIAALMLLLGRPSGPAATPWPGCSAAGSASASAGSAWRPRSPSSSSPASPSAAACRGSCRRTT